MDISQFSITNTLYSLKDATARQLAQTASADATIAKALAQTASDTANVANSTAENANTISAIAQSVAESQKLTRVSYTARNPFEVSGDIYRLGDEGNLIFINIIIKGNSSKGLTYVADLPEYFSGRCIAWAYTEAPLPTPEIGIIGGLNGTHNSIAVYTNNAWLKCVINGIGTKYIMPS